jgi:hypothetical protein
MEDAMRAVQCDDRRRREVFFVTNLFDEREKICWLCAEMDGLLCACGNQKKQEHPTCYLCKLAQEQADGQRCACGKP